MQQQIAGRRLAPGKIAPRKIATGLVFLAIAALYMVETRGLPLGEAAQMGPGYFPALLEITLAALGLAALAGGLSAPGEAPEAVGWRPLALVLAAGIVFGVAVDPLGFVPALVLALLVSGLAYPAFGLVSLLAVTAGITAFCWAVFIYGVGLPIPSFGPLLRAMS